MVVTDYKDYECRKVGNLHLMVSLAIEREAEALIDRTQIELCRYPETLTRYHINPDKDTLVGVVRNGAEYLRNIKRNEVEQWLITTNVPFSESMRTKMKEESAFEYCPEDLAQSLYNIVTDIKDIWDGTGMALLESDCDIEEGAVSVNKKRMMKRIITQTSKVITEDDNEVVRRFRKFWEDVEWMENKGYSIMPFMVGRYGGVLDALLNVVDTPNDPMATDATLLAFLMNRKFGVPWRERNRDRWNAILGNGSDFTRPDTTQIVAQSAIPIYNDNGLMVDMKKEERYGSIDSTEE